MTTASPTFAASVPRDVIVHKRTRLLAAISQLEGHSEPHAHQRVALAEAYFRLAMLPNTEPDDAIAYLQKALGYDPFHPKFFFHLGRLLHRSGDYHGAVSKYRQALRLASTSHRIYVHLALALLELDRQEKELGRALIDTLSQGEEVKLTEYLTELDDLLDAHNTRNKTNRTPSGTHGKTKVSGADKARAKPTGEAKPATVPCRWQGLWRVALVEHLSGTKLVTRQIDKYLDTGGQPVNGHVHIAEYAVALLFLMLSGESPRAVSRMAEGPVLQAHQEHPAVQLLHAAMALAQAGSPEQFMACAETQVATGLMPLELVCVLHYTNYGPSSENPLPAVKALRVLDRYSPEIQASAGFHELRLAMLDGYARLAWRDGQFEHAKLLWRETTVLDPYRIAVAHNLALLTARTKAYEEYESAWQHAAELRYLHAAAAGDVQVMLEERRVMHLSFAQQSKQHYYDPTKSADQQVREEELAAWVADRDALEVWLREWDLYYVNSRLRFRSPVHLLGVPRDATEQTINDARDALLRQIDLCFAGQPWAGIKTFCALAVVLVEQACECAADLIARARDPYYEQEKPEADALAREAIDRGFLLHRMITMLVEQAAAKHIPVGCAIARHQFALPWKLLQPICADRGLIERDLDLVKVFESHFVALAAGDKSEPANPQEAAARLAALDECIALLPHRVELMLMRCQLLITTKQHRKAYCAALAALPAADKIADQEEGRVVKHNLLVLIDNAAFAELPDRVKKPETPEAAEETLKEGRRVLPQFPRAAALRAFLAHLMIQLGDEAHTQEATELLQEGIQLALNEEQRKEFQNLLTQARDRAQVAGVMEEIKKLLEGASQRVNKAFEAIQSGGSREALQRARDVVVEAIRDARHAEQLALRDGLRDAAQHAAEFRRQLEEAQAKLRNV